MTGQTINCPHCQLETLLFIPPIVVPPKQPKPASKNTSASWLGLRIVATIIVVAIFAALLFKKEGPTNPTNLKPVGGAFGWKLGDKLPEQFRKNQASEGRYTVILTEKMPPFESVELAITDDGRIYSIEATGYAPDTGEDPDTCKSALISLLTEKYGRRKIIDGFDTFGDDYRFGSDDQTAHLHIFKRNLFTLTYSDEKLSRTYYIEVEARKKKDEDEKKAALSKGL